jgi:hypothetical protein
MCHNEKIKSRVNNSKYLTESELKVAISHRVRGKGGNITVLTESEVKVAILQFSQSQR